MVTPRDLLPPNYQDLLIAGSELVRAQFLGPLDKRLFGLESISRQAGRLLFDQGAAPSIDAGMVMFHEAITVDKPSLRRVFRRLDERAGRRPRRKRTKAQKLVAQMVKAGQVNRAKNGAITSFTPRARAAIKKQKAEDRKKIMDARKKRERATLKRLGVRR